MRIDREAFLLAAVSALAGCERVEPPQARLPSFAPAEAPRPAIARVVVTEPAPPVPIAIEEPPPPARPKPSRRVTAATRWFLGLSMEQRTNVKALCEDRVAHPCAGLLARLIDKEEDPDDQAPKPEPEEDPADKFLAGMSPLQRRQANQYCQESMPGPSCETPLVVAFDNQPIDFATAGRGLFAFVPGAPMSTDWPTAATPWIARDLDGDGAITSGAELFGSSTELAGGTARNGFQALAALDANDDGTLDARDPAFAKLLLWSDRDGDHRSSPDELRQLASVVTAIPLAHTLDARCNTRDDCEGERGTLRWRDATGTEHVGAVVDVYLPRR